MNTKIYKNTKNKECEIVAIRETPIQSNHS